MSTLQFYLERAAQSRREADQASLSNVRNRCICSAAAWEGMAARMQRTREYRDHYTAARADRPGHPPKSAPAQTKHHEQNECDEHEGAQSASPADSPAPPR